MWSILRNPLAHLAVAGEHAGAAMEKRWFTQPTVDEIALQKLVAAHAELESAVAALKVAHYRMHIANAEIEAQSSWLEKNGQRSQIDKLAANMVYGIVGARKDGE